jgi:cystathionine beta-lyase
MKYNFDEIIPRQNTNSVKYDLRKVIFGNENVLPMWVADMDFKTPDFIVDALKKRCEHEIFGYTFRSENFNKSIKNWMLKRHNWKIENNWISFSPAVVPALNFAVLAYTNPGDKIIVQSPVYFPFFSAIENHNRVKIDNPLKLINNRYEIDFEHLESIIDEDVKMIILCSPHNPCSRVWSKEELEKLSNLCVKNNIVIVSDEIHSDLVLKPFKHTPIATISDEIANQTITFIAPSKTFNLAGLQTSAVICSNAEMLKKFTQTMESFHIEGGNIFGAIALETAYTKGEEWLEQLLDYIQENANFAKNFIEKNIPKIKVVNLEATYLLWLDCRELNIPNKELKNIFVNQANVGMNDGRMFGTGGDGFFRMNIACPRSILEKALEQIDIRFSDI